MCPIRTRPVLRLALTLLLWFGAFGTSDGAPSRAAATHRERTLPKTTTITVQPADVNTLLQCLLGPGVEVANAVLTAAPSAAGTFANALTVIGIDQGIILSSGDITGLIGPNSYDDFTMDNGLPGDPDLDALIPGYVTYDATILEFDFTCDNPVVVSFQFVFASEEYNEWVDSSYNDVFGFFLNGVNIAAVPASCSHPAIPVAINNVNCLNPYGPPDGLNCNCYRNNDLDDGGGLIDSEQDGFTQVFFASGAIAAGDNHMKIAIADAGDHVLDSNVMIRCQSFECVLPEDTGACCFGSNCFTLTPQECVDQGGTFLGLDIDCQPTPCDAVGVETEDGTQDLLPPESCLLQSAPNPLSRTATISFALGEASSVSLIIYDVAGRPVKTLVSESLPAGSYSVTWDGNSSRGRRLPSGVYFCRMFTGSFAQTLRVVLSD